MSRDLSPDMITEVTALQLRPCILFKAEFDSGDVMLWTGLGQITWNGDLYEGAGNLIGVNEVNEVIDVEAQGSTIVLSGIPSGFIEIALDEPYQGRPVTVYFGTIAPDGTLIADPIILYKGRIDVMQISEDGTSSTIAIACESRLIDLRRVKVRRYTTEDQKTTYPNDRGLEFVPALQEKEIIWGKKS